MNKGHLKNAAAAGIVAIGLYAAYQKVTAEPGELPSQPDLQLDLGNNEPGLTKPLFPQLDENGLPAPSFDASPFPFPSPAYTRPSFLVPDALRPVFAGAVISNFNALQFSGDGQKIQSAGAFVRISNLDCTAARQAVKDHIQSSPDLQADPNAREGIESLAKQLFQTGELEVLSLHMKRDELPPEAAELNEESRQAMLEIQKLFWEPDWPDSVDVNITLQCRADTFGHDL
jgi:hypothetical protein